MQRRQFLKAALGAVALPFVPIPAPVPPKPLTMAVISEAVKRCVEKGTLIESGPRDTITTLDGIFKRTYGAALHRDMASLTRVKI